MIRALHQQAVYGDPVVGDWPRIRAPTLVIGGDRDGANFPALARSVVDALPDAQLHLIPNVGHNPQFERPDLLFPPLVAFLKSGSVK
jgi:pimeloyl-ACP methyl ester carboxylesterase